MEDQHVEDAWVNAETRYQARQAIQGIVTRVAQFGVFVQVEPGVEGILYAFELGHGPAALARFTPGQAVQCYVKDIDERKKRLELSLESQFMPGLQPGRELPPQARRQGQPDTPSELAQFPFPFPLLREGVRQDERSCPACQRQVQASWKYCVYCGDTLQRRCSACGTTQPVLFEARYCCECGSLLP